MQLPALLKRRLSPLAPTLDVLICIYTCEQHRRYLNEFYASVVGHYLMHLPNVLVLEVYADPHIHHSRHHGNRLILRTWEKYEALSLKTFEMIRYCVQYLQFRRLLKIDVTTVRTIFEPHEYEGLRTPIDQARLVQFLEQSPSEKDYDGFELYAQVLREDAMTWARIKGGIIDYERLFGDGPMPPYFTGKCYFLSRAFASFISEHGAGIAQEHVDFLLGSEDVMVGRLFQKFERSSRQ